MGRDGAGSDNDDKTRLEPQRFFLGTGVALAKQVSA